ncbi:rhotekin-2 [Lampris incognitus]|uniref:rhotekin-2 n=1 Tax=Lampris incognitus TaxID=2546036 RepID=UPI0024B5D88F|nr:rhotekin-2 [Lampris incognitus]
MDDPRNFQTTGRNSKSTASSCSALAMEVKRKKIRQSTVFLHTEETNIQEKLDFEMRMRDGAYKLLLASSKREQVLSASKNLLTCNIRIKAYLSQLRKKEEQDMMGAAQRLSDPASEGRMPCTGKVGISGLRIPLLWKDSDYFNNKGSSRRVAVFCLMRIGSQVFDTEMVVVDRSATDVFFEGVTVFSDAVPQFEVRVELWSCAMEEELTLVNTPKKLAKKLLGSFGKASGRKDCSLLDTPDPDIFLQSNPIPSGAKYSLLAYTTLCLSQVEDSFQSHSLIVLQDAEWSSWLPLYGNLCCRLVAQPACMTQHVMTGYLSQQQNVDGLHSCCNLFCVLSAGSLSCYFTPEEIAAKVEPTLHLPINKDTRIRVIKKDSAGRKSSVLSIINPSSAGPQTIVFKTDTREELEDWMDAFHQHIYDQGQWLQCSDQLMKIEVASPRKPPLFLTKQANSVYNDLSINSPGKFESITDIIHSKIEETDGQFLIGQEEEREAPNWSTLFDGSHPMVVQKSFVSPNKSSISCSSPNPNTSSVSIGNKKRRAPPPPCDRQPYASSSQPVRPPLPVSVCPSALLNQEKENTGTFISRPAMKPKTGRPSLDAKFSAIIQQLQRNNAGGAGPLRRKNAPLGQLDVQPHGQPQLTHHEMEFKNQHAEPPEATVQPAHERLGPSLSLGPVPAPRSKLRKSFREKINPKAW